MGGLQFAIEQLEQAISEIRQDRDIWKSNYALLDKRFEAFKAGIVEPKWYEKLWNDLKWFLIGAATGGLILSL